jgi:hypothetical protein
MPLDLLSQLVFIFCFFGIVAERAGKTAHLLATEIISVASFSSLNLEYALAPGLFSC